MATAFVYNDGGRKSAGYKGQARDCVVRAIAIATQQPYEKVRQDLMATTQDWVDTSRTREARKQAKEGASTRNGVYRAVYDRYLKSLGWEWTPTMKIGSGCKVHLRREELPTGRIICSVSKHLVAVVDGIIHDTEDPSRDGTRCVYGYWTSPKREQKL